MSRTPRPRSPFRTHIVWNPLLGLFCHADIGIFIEVFADEKVLERNPMRQNVIPVVLNSTLSGTIGIEVAVRLGTIAAIEIKPSSDINRNSVGPSQLAGIPLGGPRARHFIRRGLHTTHLLDVISRYSLMLSVSSSVQRWSYVPGLIHCFVRVCPGQGRRALVVASLRSGTSAL